MSSIPTAIDAQDVWLQVRKVRGVVIYQGDVQEPDVRDTAEDGKPGGYTDLAQNHPEMVNLLVNNAKSTTGTCVLIYSGYLIDV